MRRLVNQYQDRVLIGEIYLPVERLVQYYGADLGGVHIRSTFSFSWPTGRHAISLASSGNTRRRCRSMGGRIGFSATTTGRASHPGSVWRRLGWRRCCCSLCAARRRFIMAMRSACMTWRFLRKRSRTRSRKMFRARGLGRDPAAHAHAVERGKERGIYRGRTLVADCRRLRPGERRSRAR